MLKRNSREASQTFTQSVVSLLAGAIWVLVFVPYAVVLLGIALFVRRRVPGPSR